MVGIRHHGVHGLIAYAKFVKHQAHSQPRLDGIEITVRIQDACPWRIVKTYPLLPVEQKHIYVIAVAGSGRIHIDPRKPLLRKENIRLPVGD